MPVCVPDQITDSDRPQCSGERPVCRRCVQHRLGCQYSTEPGESRMGALKRRYGQLTDQATASERLLDLLRTLPDNEARSILQRIRAGSDPVTVYNQITAGDTLIQLAVAPETRFRYELPYRAEMPFELAEDNPYLDSLIYEATSLLPANRNERRHSHHDHTSGSGPSAGQISQEASRVPYLKPFHASTVVEPLLTDVKPSAWTSVCTDDVLMRHLLESLLHCEYSFTSAFQKIYFLEDMAAGRRDFCSPLLVNVVLSYACVRSMEPHLLASQSSSFNPSLGLLITDAAAS